MKGGCEHVVFDLDGTLVDSREDLTASVNHVRAIFDLPPLPPRKVYSYVGDGARVLVQRALGEGRRDSWEAGVESFLDYYAEHLLDRTRLYPGMADLLARLRRADVAVSVLTNKPESFSHRILDGLGVLDGLIGVIGGDTLAVRKPAPDGVHRLIRGTGTPPSRALLVGDSPVDAATAAAGGIAFCGVRWGIDPARLQNLPVALVASANELEDVILGSW